MVRKDKALKSKGAGKDKEIKVPWQYYRNNQLLVKDIESVHN